MDIKRVTRQFGIGKKKKSHMDVSGAEITDSEYSAVTEHTEQETSKIELQSSSERPKSKSSKRSDYQAKILAQLESLTYAVTAQQNIQKDQLAILQHTEKELASKREKKDRIILQKQDLPEPVIKPDLSAVPKLVEPISSTTSMVDLQEKYSRDVRRAFQIATSQLILLLLLTLGYFTVNMIDDYLPPFFWAVLLSIMLRKPKTVLMELSDPIKDIETENLGYFGTMKKKFIFLLTTVITRYAKHFVGVVIAAKLVCFTIGWGCWVPWLSLIIGVTAFVLIIIVIASVSNSSSLEGFFTTVLVFGFLILVILFIVTFGFKAVTETGDFAFKIQAMVEEKVHDPMWADLLSEYGVTEESIAAAIKTGRSQLDIWVESQGYNMTEIEETVISYGEMLTGTNANGNMTVVEGDIVPANDTAVAESGWMDYIPDIGFDELQEYYNSAMEIIDFEQVSNVASSVGGFLFGTGHGVLGLFSSILGSLLGAVDILLQVIVFIGALFYFMSSPESIISSGVRIVPVSQRQQEYLAETIHQNIIQVFVTSFLLFFAHGTATLLYFSIFDLDFAYSSAFIVGAMTLFPLTTPWLIYAPTLLIAYLNGSGYVLYIAVGLFVLEQLVGFVDEQIYALIPGSSPYLTGIGLAVGVSTYGVQGILIGPMLIVTTKTLFEIFCANVAQPEPVDVAGVVKEKIE